MKAKEPLMSRSRLCIVDMVTLTTSRSVLCSQVGILRILLSDTLSDLIDICVQRSNIVTEASACLHASNDLHLLDPLGMILLHSC